MTQCECGRVEYQDPLYEKNLKKLFRHAETGQSPDKFHNDVP